MNNTVWIKHPETGAVTEVPAAALPMYRQSNWDLLSDEELDALEREKVEEIIAAEQAMREMAERSRDQTPPASENELTAEELAAFADATREDRGEPEPQHELTAEELAEIAEAARGDAEPPTAEDMGAVPGPYTDDQLAVAEALPAPTEDAGGRRTKKGNA